ncbi:MAG TPA: carbamoyltransferase HypF [Thermoanaerobaculia bacterium]|nr:carbamoyltransferase HypF [Thermoanaerobaculia bacterium]
MSPIVDTAQTAQLLRVQGVVQGVGFRPFVFRLARTHGLAGWVLNAGEGVQIHVEGPAPAVDSFVLDLTSQPPPAARIVEVERTAAAPGGFAEFGIRESEHRGAPTVRVSPDLPVCARCLAELAELGEPGDRRRGYPYINCTDCGPRFSIILGLPYDRQRTTMRGWTMCPRCAAEYRDPLDRRFHAQPVACPDCGPHYRLSHGEEGGRAGRDVAGDEAAIREAARLLAAGLIVAVKGIGGYHLACDARNAAAVAALRERKFRKEKPFALMARDLRAARQLAELGAAAAELLTSPARPIVLAPARVELAGVAPGNRDLGIMLPYAPLHHLLFAAGAPEVLVLTSANRSSEPIAYVDGEARERLGGIADAFLVGERPIARRVDDSVGTVTALGPALLRRSRGYAPGAAARLPATQPILALGADLKNAVTLVVGGEAYVSQHLGDLDHYGAFRAFQETVRDLTAMYEIDWERLLIAHDSHPQYASTLFAQTLSGAGTVAVQHHRAHVASVLAERGALDRRVLGIALDGTGYGDDGAIWGGEIFAGSVRDGLVRVAHLRQAVLPGGDAAARHPVQAAAGFLAGMDGLPDLTAAPFALPRRYLHARALVEKGLRTFPTTSAGRLFDTAAALLGFTRPVSFEGQAAIWLEQLARTAGPGEDAYPMGRSGEELDFRPLLAAMIEERLAGRSVAAIARSFHQGLAAGIAAAAVELARGAGLDTVVLSGGVFQNRLLLERTAALLGAAALTVWTNREVPANDGGISLGQAAVASVGVSRATLAETSSQGA